MLDFDTIRVPLIGRETCSVLAPHHRTRETSRLYYTIRLPVGVTVIPNIIGSVASCLEWGICLGQSSTLNQTNSLYTADEIYAGLFCGPLLVKLPSPRLQRPRLHSFNNSTHDLITAPRLLRYRATRYQQYIMTKQGSPRP